MPSQRDTPTVREGNACLAESSLPFTAHLVPSQWRGECCTAARLERLLVVMVSGSSDNERQAIRRSADGLVRALSSSRTVASLVFHVLAYDNDAAAWGSTPQSLPASARSDDSRKNGMFYVTDAALHSRVYSPKFAIVALSLPRLRAMHGIARPTDAVWLPDGDIDFNGFEADRFFRRWRCAFPGGPPLISQPTIRGPTVHPTQLWWPLQATSWQTGGVFGPTTSGQQPIALLSDLVEMQAPLFDGLFFDWLFNVIGALIGSMNIAQGHGWGIDNVWCGAALTFANRSSSPRRPHCAILPIELVHRDTRTTPRDTSSAGRGVHAVRLTCLIARHAARSAGAEQRWMSNPKSMGYYGPLGFNRTVIDDREENPVAKRRLRRALLHRASYKIGARCQPLSAQRRAPGVEW